MTEPIIYIGLWEVRSGDEVLVTIAVSPDPEDFNGTYYPITAESGEGSFADLLFKLKRGFIELKGGKSANEKV